MAIDNGIPLITDIECARLYIEALEKWSERPTSCARPCRLYYVGQTCQIAWCGD